MTALLTIPGTFLVNMLPRIAELRHTVMKSIRSCQGRLTLVLREQQERLLYMLCGDSDGVAEWMRQLKESKTYDVGDTMNGKLRDLFSADCLTEDEVLDTISRWFGQCGYLADTHTAVGLGVYERYRHTTGDVTPTVVLSTASPYKFPVSVCRAVTGETLTDEEAAVVLMKRTGIAVPDCLNDVMERPVIHRQVIDANRIVSFIKEGLTNL